jgi:hypothetical protein
MGGRPILRQLRGSAGSGGMVLHRRGSARESNLIPDRMRRISSRGSRGLKTLSSRYHLADLAAIGHDLCLDVVASNLSALRELSVRLHQRICGLRLLRGVNRPLLGSDPHLAAVLTDGLSIAGRGVAEPAKESRRDQCRHGLDPPGSLFADGPTPGLAESTPSASPGPHGTGVSPS